MADEGNTTNINEFFDIVTNYIVGIQPFFDLAEEEIKSHNSTDFDNIEFLIDGARAKLLKFAAQAHEIEKKSKGTIG